MMLRNTRFGRWVRKFPHLHWLVHNVLWCKPLVAMFGTKRVGSATSSGGTQPPPNQLTCAVLTLPATTKTGLDILVTVTGTGGVSNLLAPWQFVAKYGDGLQDIANGAPGATSAVFNHAWATAGSFTIQATVKDSAGTTASGQASVTITAGVPPPQTVTVTATKTATLLTWSFTGITSGATAVSTVTDLLTAQTLTRSQVVYSSGSGSNQCPWKETIPFLPDPGTIIVKDMTTGVSGLATV